MRNYSIERASSPCTFLRKIRLCPTNRQSLSWPLWRRCHPRQDCRPCQGTSSHWYPPGLSSFRLRRPFSLVCRRLLGHPAHRGLRPRSPWFHRCPRSKRFRLRRPFSPVYRRLLGHPARRGLRPRPPWFHRCPRSESHQCHPRRQLPFHRCHPDYRPCSQARPTLPRHRSRTRLRISRSRRGRGACWWPAQVGSKLSALVPFERSIDQTGEKSTREAERRRLRSIRGDESHTIVRG